MREARYMRLIPWTLRSGSKQVFYPIFLLKKNKSKLFFGLHCHKNLKTHIFKCDIVFSAQQGSIHVLTLQFSENFHLPSTRNEEEEGWDPGLQVDNNHCSSLVERSAPPSPSHWLSVTNQQFHLALPFFGVALFVVKFQQGIFRHLSVFKGQSKEK
jgi:hypothetical protein